MDTALERKRLKVRKVLKGPGRASTSIRRPAELLVQRVFIFVRSSGSFAISQSGHAWLRWVLMTDATGKLHVEVRGNLLIVSELGTSLYAIYTKPADQPALVMVSSNAAEDQQLCTRFWKAANDKARELGWIV
jgi:hypothetical protein